MPKQEDVKMGRWRRWSLLAAMSALAAAAIVGTHSTVTPESMKAAPAPGASRPTITLMGGPFTHHFSGQIGETAEARWELVGTPGFTADFDGAFVLEGEDQKDVLAKALKLSYAVGDGGNPVWVDGGTLREPLSFRQACLRADASCNLRIQAGSTAIKVRVTLVDNTELASHSEPVFAALNVTSQLARKP